MSTAAAMTARTRPPPLLGQAGVIPQTTFIVGTPLYLYPAGALYVAIGSSNLRLDRRDGRRRARGAVQLMYVHLPHRV
jgi:hypothetical protein